MNLNTNPPIRRNDHRMGRWERMRYRMVDIDDTSTQKFVGNNENDEHSLDRKHVEEALTRAEEGLSLSEYAKNYEALVSDPLRNYRTRGIYDFPYGLPTVRANFVQMEQGGLSLPDYIMSIAGDADINMSYFGTATEEDTVRWYLQQTFPDNLNYPVITLDDIHFFIGTIQGEDEDGNELPFLRAFVHSPPLIEIITRITTITMGDIILPDDEDEEPTEQWMNTAIHQRTDLIEEDEDGDDVLLHSETVFISSADEEVPIDSHEDSITEETIAIREIDSVPFPNAQLIIDEDGARSYYLNVPWIRGTAYVAHYTPRDSERTRIFITTDLSITSNRVPVSLEIFPIIPVRRNWRNINDYDGPDWVTRHFPRGSVSVGKPAYLTEKYFEDCKYTVHTLGIDLTDLVSSLSSSSSSQLIVHSFLVFGINPRSANHPMASQALFQMFHNILTKAEIVGELRIDITQPSLNLSLICTPVLRIDSIDNYQVQGTTTPLTFPVQFPAFRYRQYNPDGSESTLEIQEPNTLFTTESYLHYVTRRRVGNSLERHPTLVVQRRISQTEVITLELVNLRLQSSFPIPGFGWSNRTFECDSDMFYVPVTIDAFESMTHLDRINVLKHLYQNHYCTFYRDRRPRGWWRSVGTILRIVIIIIAVVWAVITSGTGTAQSGMLVTFAQGLGFAGLALTVVVVLLKMVIALAIQMVFTTVMKMTNSPILAAILAIAATIATIYITGQIDGQAFQLDAGLVIRCAISAVDAYSGVDLVNKMSALESARAAFDRQFDTATKLLEDKTHELYGGITTEFLANVFRDKSNPPTSLMSPSAFFHMSTDMAFNHDVYYTNPVELFFNIQYKTSMIIDI